MSERAEQSTPYEPSTAPSAASPPPSAEELLAAAERYAAAGLKIYPVFIRGLKPDGKKDVRVPLKSWHEATDDLGQVRAWWGERYRGAGIGVDMGASRLAVADADVKDGVDGIARLQREIDAASWSTAPLSHTPSGGVHAWYADPDGEMGTGSNIFGTKEEPSGVDGRGVGGTIFMPPTFVPGYGRYAWAAGAEPRWEGLPRVPACLAEVCPPGGRGKRTETYTELHGATRSAGQGVVGPFMTTSQASASASLNGTGGGYVHRDRVMTREAATERLRPLWEVVRDTRPPNGLWQAVADFARAAAHYQCFWAQGDVERMVLAAYAEGGHGYGSLDSGDLRAVAGGFQLQRQARDAGDLDDGWAAQPATSLDPATPDSVAEVAEDAVEALLAEMLTPSQIKERPGKRSLIKGLMYLDSEIWLIGAPGSRKSFVALDMAAHVAAGRPWQGLRVAQGPVVIIAAESSGGIGDRVKAWEAEHGVMHEEVHILPRPVQAVDTAGWAVLVKACARLMPVMVIGDTQARLTVGLEENSAKEMGIYISAIGAIRAATGAGVMSVHHTGRQGGDARGSSAIDGAQDTELKMITSKEPLRGELQVEKQKEMAEREPIKLAFKVHTVGLDEDGDPVTSLAVRSSDVWRTAADADVPMPEDWEIRWAEAQRRIIRVLADQGGEVGLTKAATKANVADRWHEGKTGRTSGLRTSTFDTAWTRVLEARSPDGDPIAPSAGGQRYAIDPVALKSYTEACTEENALQG